MLFGVYPALAQRTAPPAEISSVYQQLLFESPPASEDLLDRSIPKEQKLEADRLLQTAWHFQRKLVLENRVYAGGPFTRYLRRLAIPFTSAAAFDTSRLFVTRLSSPNAFALSQGPIFFNVGLFSVVESADELAFILAHEIVHVQKQHALNSFLRQKEISASEINYRNPTKSALRRLRYSRSDEQEADAEGLALLTTTDYDPWASVRALERLQDTFLLKLETDSSLRIFGKPMDSLEGAALELLEETYGRDDEGRLGTLTGERPERFMTHPGGQRRRDALREMLRMRFEMADADSIPAPQPDPELEALRKLAFQHMAANSYRENDYDLSLYMALRLMQQYPDEPQFQAVALQNLYWIGYYLNNGRARDILSFNTGVEYDDYKRLTAWLLTRDATDFQKATYELAKRLHRQYPDHESIAFYHALSARQYLGQGTAALFFADYRRQFPNGRYRAYQYQSNKP